MIWARSTRLGIALMVMHSAVSSSLFASGGPGTTSSPFLQIPVSGRAAALAGTVGADTGDIDNLDYNPAAINGIDRINIMATYISYIEQSSLQTASLGFPINLSNAPPKQEVMKGAEFTPQQLIVGLEYRQFKADDVARSAVLGAKGNTFNIRSQLGELALAYPITSHIGVGVAGKMISDEVESKTAKSTAGDIGLTALLNSHWTLAAGVQNFGSSGKFEQKSDPLHRQTRGSLSYSGGSWMALADAAVGTDGVVRTSAGLEWALGSIIRLRAGAYHDTDLELTGGLGLRIHGPQKLRRPTMRPPSGKNNATSLSDIARGLIAKSSEKLIRAAVDSKLLTSPSPIAIYPLNSKDATGTSIADGYTTAFKQSKDFLVLGAANRDRSDTMLVGNIEDQGETWRVTSRIVMADTADTIATDHFDIAKDDLYVRGKLTLESTQTTVKNENTEMSFSSLDLGLDYGLSTHKDLGITHTFSLKILY